MTQLRRQVDSGEDLGMDNKGNKDVDIGNSPRGANLQSPSPQGNVSGSGLRTRRADGADLVLAAIKTAQRTQHAHTRGSARGASKSNKADEDDQGFPQWHESSHDDGSGRVTSPVEGR